MSLGVVSALNPQHILDQYIANARADRKNRPLIVYQVTATITQNKDKDIAHAIRTIDRDGVISWGNVQWDSPPTLGEKGALQKVIEGESNSSADNKSATSAGRDPDGAINYCNYAFTKANALTNAKGDVIAFQFQVDPMPGLLDDPNIPHKERFVSEKLTIDAKFFREIGADGKEMKPHKGLEYGKFTRSATLQGNLRIDQHTSLLSAINHLIPVYGGNYDVELEYSPPTITP